MPTLFTKRLLLRPLRESDLSSLQRYLADPEVMRHALFERVLAADEAENFIRKHFAHSRDDGRGLGVLCLRSTNVVIGFAGLLPCQYLDPEDVEFGFVIGPEYQGQGYATEIGRELIRHVLIESRKPRVLALVNAANAASRKVLEEKLHMTFAGEIETSERGLRRVYEATVYSWPLDA